MGLRTNMYSQLTAVTNTASVTVVKVLSLQGKRLQTENAFAV